MQFHVYLAEIAAAVRNQDGDKLSSLLTLDGPHIPLLLMNMHDSSVSPRRYGRQEFGCILIALEIRAIAIRAKHHKSVGGHSSHAYTSDSQHGRHARGSIQRTRCTCQSASGFTDLQAIPTLT
jgi:hypothetical protein